MTYKPRKLRKIDIVLGLLLILSICPCMQYKITILSEMSMGAFSVTQRDPSRQIFDLTRRSQAK